MSKVVAVFEKPSCCMACPMSVYGDELSWIEDYCALMGDDYVIHDYPNAPIPDWCPLIEIAYECDKDKCENGCNNQDCFHTTDIDHAVNFDKLGDGKYIEKRRNF